MHPASVERRLNAERRESPRDGPDRRSTFEARLEIPVALRGGWLALEAQSVKIRVAPIPAGWMALSDEDLAALVERAEEQQRRLAQ